MKRADITALFPEASKEQIDKLMDLNGADVNAARGDLQALKDQIEDLKKAGSGADESAAALNKANEDIAKLQAELAGMKHAKKVQEIRTKVSAEKKVPISLLTGETEEDCNTQADGILDFAKSQGQPTVPDGGEPRTPPASGARDLFGAWADKYL